MLKKLYKYELFSLFKTLLPVYLAILGLSVLSRLSRLFKDSENVFISLWQRLSTSLYAVSVSCVFIIGIVIVVVRFYKSLLSKQGYLTFSLPFKNSEHIKCKLFCGVFVIIFNFAVTLCSFFIMGTGTAFQKKFFETISVIWKASVKEAGTGFITLFTLLTVLLFIVAVFEKLLMFYTSMAIGQQFKNRIIASVVAYFCIYAALQVVAFMLIFVFSVAGSAIGFDIIFKSVENSGKALLTVLGLVTAYETLLSFAYYFVTRYFLVKKLNLE